LEVSFILDNPFTLIKDVTIIAIPISNSIKQKIDSLHQSYFDSTRYDYAFIGMRCAAASYDVLAHAQIVKKKKLSKTAIKNFYPKPLRKRMLKKAKRNSWSVVHQEGCRTRIWEKN